MFSYHIHCIPTSLCPPRNLSSIVLKPTHTLTNRVRRRCFEYKTSYQPETPQLLLRPGFIYALPSQPDHSSSIATPHSTPPRIHLVPPPKTSQTSIMAPRPHHLTVPEAGPSRLPTAEPLSPAYTPDASGSARRRTPRKKTRRQVEDWNVCPQSDRDHLSGLAARGEPVDGTAVKALKLAYDKLAFVQDHLCNQQATLCGNMQRLVTSLNGIRRYLSMPTQEDFPIKYGLPTLC